MAQPQAQPKAIDEIAARQRSMIHSAVEQQALRDGAKALHDEGPEAAVAVLGSFVGAWTASLPMKAAS